ncbi:MAG TPA: hypothetical protein VNA21_13920, partial [Steroidobacteraceae bacterium]|nr:hypothetical protein [Steroidobacteraceae bacterium]
DLLWRDIPGEPSVEARPPVPNNIQKQRELAGGITTNPNAMGRIGLLYLRKGKWKDTQLISESSVELAMKPRPEIAGAKVANESDFPSANLNYGLLWWTNANKQIPEVPADAFWAWGLADSLIVVIPSLDLVITRVDGSPDSTTTPHWRSETNGYPKWNGNYEILKPFLIPSVQSVTPTP